MRLTAFMVCVLASAAWAQDVTVRLRGGATAPAGTVVAVDREGVSLRADDKTTVLSWDRVAEVRGDVKAKEYADLAQRAWRARTRLERGDSVAAEPLFDALAAEYKEGTGATTLVIAEGLLRCRLHRGVQAGAVEPWLMWLRAAGDGAIAPALAIVESPGAPPLIDKTTGLCPAVPPVWLRVASVEAFARASFGSADAQAGLEKNLKGAAKVDAIRTLYALAAAFECGVASEVKSGVLPLRHPDPGVALVAQIVGARVGVVDVRRDARRLLSERLTQRQAQWMEAWVRVGLGRSLLRESAAEDQLLGVAQMLHVPARLRGASPYLAGVALAGAAVNASGTKQASAWRLKKELQDTLPGHPALDMEAVRDIRPPGAKAGSSGAMKEAS